MKLFVGILTLLGASLVHAGDNSCPNLSGKFQYVAVDQSQESFNLDVTQDVANDLTTYSIVATGKDWTGESTIVADGITNQWSETDADGTYSGEDTTFCRDGKLVTEFSESYVSNEGQTLDSYSGTETVDLDSNRDIVSLSEIKDLNGNVTVEKMKYTRRQE